MNISYNRKSTEDKGRQIQSIEDQIKSNNEIAQKMNEVIDVHVAESKSAKIPYLRLEFNKLLEKINNKEIKYLFCWKLDRLARNPIEAGIISYALQEGFIKAIITPVKTYYPEDNVLLSSVEFGMATQYSRDLSRNVKRGLYAKCEKGWRPNRAPIGYRNTMERQAGNRIVEIDKNKFHKVKRIWELALTGKYSLRNLRELARKELDIDTSISEIYYILKDKFYYGLFEYGGKIWEGKHKKMITKEQYDRVQGILERKNKPKGKLKITLNGLYICGECGYTVIPETKIKKYIVSKGEYKTYRYWRCSHKHPFVKCRQKSIEEDKLIKKTINCLKNYEIKDKFLKWGLKWLRYFDENEIKTQEKLDDKYNREFIKVKKELNNLVKKVCQNDEFIDDLKDEVNERKNYLIERKQFLIGKIKILSNRQDSVVSLTIKTLEYLQDIANRFENGNYEIKREILTQLGRTMILKDNKVDIVAEKPFLAIRKLNNYIINNNIRVEPNLNCNYKQKAHFNKVHSLFLRVMNEVQTYFSSHSTLLLNS